MKFQHLSIRLVVSYSATHLFSESNVRPPPQLRLEIQQTTDEGYPALLQSCAELQQLYAIIDTVEAAVDRSAAAASIAEERLNVLQQGFNARYGESGSLAKLTSLFKKTPGATDAPVKLPPYDPSSARLDVSSELSALREVIGDVAPEVQETGAGEEDSGQQGAVDSEAAGSDAPE